MAKTTKSEEKAPSFSLDRFAKNSYELFGISPSTFAGIAFGLQGAKEMTTAEMAKYIKNWLSQPVKIKEAE